MVLTGDNFSISNLATCPAATGVQDFTATDSADVSLGTSYGIDVTFSTCGGIYTGYGKAWIDWNGDGDFTDAGEDLGSWGPASPLAAGSTAFNATFSFTVPTTATLGATRLRVMQHEGGSATATNPCATFTWGAVEDYKIVVTNTPPPCPIPGMLAAAPAATAATITWSSTGSAFDIEYGPIGFMVGTGSTLSSTTTSVVITGLTPNTGYDVYVRNNCTTSGNGTSGWSSVRTFYTTCSSISTYPYTENFDGATWTTGAPGVVDQCWSRDQSTSVPRWQVNSGGTSSSGTGPSAANSGTQYLYLETSGGSLGSFSLLNMPALDLSSLTSPLMSFYYHMYGTNMGDLAIEVSVDTGATWTTVLTKSGQDQTANADPFKEELVDLTSYKTAHTLVRFKGIRGGSFDSDMAIDDVKIEEAPPCPKPTALYSSNITSSSALIGWLSSGSTFIIEYGPDGFTQGTGMLDTSMANTALLTGLAPNTTYNVYVLNDCSGAGNGLSAWAGPITFTTLCTAQSTPLFEGFENTATGSSVNMIVPSCWFNYEAGPSTAYGYPTATTAYVNTGTRGFYTYSVASAADTFMLISPEIDSMDVNFMQIEMWIKAVSTSTTYNNKVVIGTVADPASPGTFAAIDTLDIGSNTTFQYFQVYLNPANGYNQSHRFIAIMTAGAGGTAPTLVAYDDITISRIPNCIPSSGVTFTNLLANSGTINWTAGGGLNHQIEYGPAGFTQGTGNIITGITTTSYGLSGLTPNTCYDVYIRDSCANNLSPWAGPFTFCTPCAVLSMPYSEDFTSWTPACFSLSNTTGWDWDQDAAGYARARFWNYSTGEAYLTSGQIVISQAAQVRFKWAHQYMASYPDDRVLLRARKVNTTAWDTLADLVGPTFNSPNSGTTTPPSDPNDFVDFLTYLDTNYIGDTLEFEFVAQTDFGPNAYIDDFAVEPVPACTTPFNLSTGTITANSATINWSSVNGTCFNIEYGPLGFIQGTGNGTVVSNVTSPHTITGLSPNTYYSVYVSDCCNGTWVGPIDFKTLCLGQLAGSYTVGTPTSDFATLDSAMNVLVGCGLTAPVTFNLQGGTHVIPGQVISNITGLSATNTVTISGGGVGADTIKIAGGFAGFDFDGSGHFRFEDLTLDGSGATRTVWLHNGANDISFDNCHLWNTPGATTSTTGVIVGSGTSTSNFSAGDNASDISVSNSKIVGGYCGIIIYGSSTTNKGMDITVTNSEFEDVYYYAMRFYYMQGITVTDNQIVGNAPIYAMYAYYWDDIQIERNNLIGTTSGMYSGYVNIYRNDTPAVRSSIKNNFMVGSGTYANYNYAARHLDYAHNSVQGNGTYGAYFSATTSTTLASYDVNMYNNIFVGGSNYALYCFASNYTSLNSDYNIYHTGGANLAYWNAARADLVALKAADATQNQNSLSGDPVFVSASDLHVVGTLPNDAGLNGYATDDIDGDARPATGSTTVDIGADEYTPLNYDITPIAIVEPKNLSCGDSSSVVRVVFTNLGLQNASGVTATVNISGSQTATLTGTYSGTLASLAVDTITLGTFNTAAGGTFNIEAIMNMANDQDHSNDTIATSVTLNDILVRTPLATQDTVCPGDFSTLYYPSNTSGMSFQWLTTTGDTIGMTDSLQVGPMGSNDTTFILNPVSSSEHIGPLDNTIGAGANYTAMNHYLLFTVTQATTIIAVDVFANGAGLVDVIIQDGATQATLFTHTVPVSAGGQQTLVINQPLLPGTYRMGSSTVNNAGGLYRNSAGASYPYTSTDGAISITGNTFSTTYYYFFYNWLVGAGGCPRPDGMVTLYNAGATTGAFTQTPGAPTLTDLTVNFDASASVGATNYTWDFGDGSPTATGVTTSHAYTGNGTYTVTLIVDGLCNSDTITQPIVISGIGIEESLLNQTFTVYPNPNNGKFRVGFQVEGLKHVELRVVTLLGQELYNSKPGNISGTYEEEIDLSKVAAGVYLIQLVTDEGTVSKRVTIQK